MAEAEYSAATNDGSSTCTTQLTEEQKARIEENKKKAVDLKRKRQLYTAEAARYVRISQGLVLKIW